jgi:hypothetical protein
VRIYNSTYTCITLYLETSLAIYLSLHVYLIIFKNIILMQVQTLPGIHSDKFLDINESEHEFPDQIKTIGFSVTLLHNHGHAPMNHVLCYKSGFTLAEYQPKEKARLLTPCSWFS